MTTDSDTPRAHAGTVTAVRVQARDPNRVSVFVDGRFSLGLPVDAAAELGIRKGTELDGDLLARALTADASYKARQRAMSLLAHRPRAEAEIRDRLRRAGFEDPVVEDTVDRLTRLGYLDDEAFALAYARSRAASRGYGPVRIFSELRRRGVPEGVARAAVTLLSAERESMDDALSAGRKAWKRVASEPDARRRRNRLYGALARRGFDPETIARVIDVLERQP